jgi:glycosyltransferase involved in cell wall biosynthesis
MLNKQDLPKISIITPSFNQGHYIEQTIISVLEQNYPALEYIIIDGGSTDNTPDIIRKYERYITYWTSEKDEGQSHAINKGVRLATGDVINWLNSDDYYMPGVLEHVGYRFLNPHISAYCGRSRIFSEETEYISKGTDVYKDNLAKTIGWARIDQPETFFRRKVWEDIGLLNQNFHYVMDKEFWIRYLFAYGLNEIALDDKVLVNFRIHNQSKTGSQKESFRQETIDLFYSLANLCSSREKETFKIFKARSKDLFGYKNINLEVLGNVINYFLLYVLFESYAQDNYPLAKQIKGDIDIPSLNENDQKELRKTLFRLKYLPVGFKRIYNRIRT